MFVNVEFRLSLQEKFYIKKRRNKSRTNDNTKSLIKIRDLIEKRCQSQYLGTTDIILFFYSLPKR